MSNENNPHTITTSGEGWSFTITTHSDGDPTGKPSASLNELLQNFAEHPAAAVEESSSPPDSPTPIEDESPYSTAELRWVYTESGSFTLYPELQA